MTFERLGSADEFRQTGDKSETYEDSGLIYEPLAEGEFDASNVIELTESDLVEVDFSRAPTAVIEDMQSAPTVMIELTQLEIDRIFLATESSDNAEAA